MTSSDTAPAPALDRPEIGTQVDVGGIRTNVLQAGDGAPVVLVHGSGPGVTAYANWRLTIPALAQRFRVVAPDMLGFGFTERPVPPMVCDTDRWVAHLVGLLDALGLEKVSLVGNSFGGGIALRLAARHPDRVERLVLMGAVGVPFPITAGPRRPGDPAELVADSRRLRALLGWSPRHDDLDYIADTAWRWEQALNRRQRVAVGF